MKFDLIIRRVGVTLALAVVLACIVALINEDAALLLFLPSWAALFFGWPHLSRQSGFDVLSAPVHKLLQHPLSGSRLLITAMLAIVLSVVFARMIDADVFSISFFLFWLVLYSGWPYVTRQLAFLNLKKAPVSPGMRRPRWLRLIRGTLAWVGGIGLALACMSSIVIVPIALCQRRAQKVHDSIHIGMTVQEVLDTAKDCDVFQAGSEFPYDEKTDGDNIPAMGLNWRRDGTYGTYDLAARRYISFTESEAIERLHAKLHDGYKWRFHYTYTNMTPMHMSFTVVFGPDGRLAEVKPVSGWD